MIRNKISDNDFVTRFNEYVLSYRESDDPEDLEALIRWTDQHVEFEKRSVEYRFDAFQKLRMLEEVVELKRLQLYRKAVLLISLKGQDKKVAYSLFMRLILDQDTESYIRDRSIAYVLMHFEDYLRQRDFLTLYDILKASSDEKAREALETIEIKLVQMAEDQDELYAEDVDSYAAFEQKVAFVSDDRRQLPIPNRQAEMLWRLQYLSENYQLYLDFVSGSFYLAGKLSGLNMKESTLLARIAMSSNKLDVSVLYKLFFDEEEYEPSDKVARNKFDKAIGRLSEKLLAAGILFKRHRLAASTTYCLIYPESLALDWDT